jgi:hypothetical protein
VEVVILTLVRWNPSTSDTIVQQLCSQLDMNPFPNARCIETKYCPMVEKKEPNAHHGNPEMIP